MEIMRLVVTGTVGAGKSTFIRSVSEIEVVDTDRQATDETALLKQKTVMGNVPDVLIALLNYYSKFISIDK